MWEVLMEKREASVTTWDDAEMCVEKRIYPPKV